MSAHDVRVLGIDPGLANTGWGVVQAEGSRLHHVAHGTIKTSSTDSFDARLVGLGQELEEIIGLYSPVGLGIETLVFSRNVTSAIPVSHARGVSLFLSARNGLTIREFSPTTIKQSIVGNGRADKHQIQFMVQRLLGLTEIPGPDHCSDALAASITFIQYNHLM